uniref:Uncharacterized protein n=1 Tax=Caenorhabditis japonica TaxID=281687 RepID=A0A8R1DKI4_CAEJA
MLLAYIRHRQTVEYYAHRLGWENATWRSASTVIAGIGMFTALCITIIAHYRIAKDDKDLSPPWLLEASLWVVAICFHIFIITFSIELRFSYMHSPKVIFLRSDEQSAPILRNGEFGEEEINNNR